ncbi:MAG: glutaredoxin domain-containing protein [Leptospiraceae bacterium]|nr:glutaredoxin domain-containing protein [Leptospiraceae bacterium]
MGLQIFGKKKCSDTKKAERFFKERNIKFQLIDLDIKNISKGELTRVTRNINPNDLIDKESKEFQASNYKYMKFDPMEVLLESSKFTKTPIVALDKDSTLGYRPEVWNTWKLK